METKYNLVFKVLNELNNAELLDDIILIGSWVQYFYKIYFNESPEIPVVRTTDIDFLILNTNKVKNEKNITKILEKLGFEIAISYPTEYTKYVHPELEIEFLVPMIGRYETKPMEIKSLHVTAQRFRFFDLLQEYIMKIPFKNMEIKIPEPCIYVLHKLIISERRLNKYKKQKDISVAKEIGEFLLENEQQKKRLAEIFNSLPLKWQNKVLNNIINDTKKLYKYLTDCRLKG